jgi:hypothetical protein
MALQNGHRFSVAMRDAFPDGLYAMGVEQAMDYDEKSGRQSPSKDKQTGELVWTVTCIDRDPNIRGTREIKIKVLAPYMPELPPEIVPNSGIRPVEFAGITVTPYVSENGRRARLALSYRATGVYAQGKAPQDPVQHKLPMGPPPGEHKAA